MSRLTIRPVTSAALRQLAARVPSVPFVTAATPIEPMPNLARSLGRGPRLFIKRDDAIPFGFGGNKVRKLALVAAQALADGADTLITAGGVQSNHARATASAAARLGLRAVLVANGEPPRPLTANALLDDLLGAEVVYVPSRDARAPMMQQIAERLRREGRTPFVIPIGASTPLGALAFALAVAELIDQLPAPDVIVHATSSGGTQAGLVAGCRLLNLHTRVVGISADDPSAQLEAQVRTIVSGVWDLLEVDAVPVSGGTEIEVDDRFVGDGYGIPTEESRDALRLAARTEAIFLDPTYTAKAMAGLLASIRERRFTQQETVVFWHTGGQPGLFA